MDKPREYWIHSEHGEVSTPQTFPTKSDEYNQKCIHVIEYAAYNQAIYERDKSASDHAKRNNELRSENEQLRKRVKELHG